MTNEDLTVLILDKLGWDYDLVLNTNRYSGSQPILAGDLILAFLVSDTGTKAAEYLSVPYKKVYTCTERWLTPLFGKLQGGGETWKYTLLSFIEYKRCSSCKKILAYTEFGKDNGSRDGLYHYCKVCRIPKNAETYKQPYIQEAHKRSQELHKEDIYARNAKYRADRNHRVVPWSELELIKEVYGKCPEDCQVDHELPLKGELISGLHVVRNLQYLTIEDNIRKGNRVNLDEYNKKYYGT